jgi:hypothetical protein
LSAFRGNLFPREKYENGDPPKIFSAAHGHIFYKKYLTKGQKEPKAGLGRRKVFQKMNERI